MTELPIATFISNLLTAQGLTSLGSLLILFVEFMYLTFAFIMVRRVALMNSSLKTEAALLFRFLSFVHFFMSLGLFILSVLLLL